MSHCSSARSSIDPNFAIAHAQLGLAYSGLGESLLGEQSTSKAYELRDHANDRERFFIMTIYDRQVTGNLEKEAETFRLWAQTYPRDPVAPGLMRGFFAAGTGQYRADDPESPRGDCHRPRRRSAIPAYFSVVWGYVCLGRPNDAEQPLQQAMTARPTNRTR